MLKRRASRGFTLVELILVIVVGSVLAGTLVVFFKPAMDSYLAARGRADLADQTDTAMRRMARDVRVAVPNSIRTPGSACFELVPTSTGGRYRTADDTSVSGAAPVDTSTTTTQFDVLTPLSSTPSVGDWVVVGNQNPADLYGGVDRAAITSVDAPAPAAALGRHRLGITALQFPIGYDGARFTVVPATRPAVFYVCSGAGVDASGNGTGTLYRLRRDFVAAYPSACPAVSASDDVLATRISSCSFVYDPNQGATQQSGFVWMQLELKRNNETAHLAMGAHIDNVP